jgi:hypothetical protein
MIESDVPEILRAIAAKAKAATSWPPGSFSIAPGRYVMPSPANCSMKIAELKALIAKGKGTADERQEGLV